MLQSFDEIRFKLVEKMKANLSLFSFFHNIEILDYNF